MASAERISIPNTQYIDISITYNNKYGRMYTYVCICVCAVAFVVAFVFV